MWQENVTDLLPGLLSLDFMQTQQRRRAAKGLPTVTWRFTGALDPYTDPDLLRRHMREMMTVAWAAHEGIADYTAATLAWLESRGTANITRLVEELAVHKLAALSPARQASPPFWGL